MATWIALAASPRSSVWQDLLKRPFNPVDFFPNYSDRLLVSRWMGQRSDSFQSASYLMIPGPNKLEPGAPLLAISVNAADEFSGQPGKDPPKKHLSMTPLSLPVEP